MRSNATQNYIVRIYAARMLKGTQKIVIQRQRKIRIIMEIRLYPPPVESVARISTFSCCSSSS